MSEADKIKNARIIFILSKVGNFQNQKVMLINYEKTQ